MMRDKRESVVVIVEELHAGPPGGIQGGQKAALQGIAYRVTRRDAPHHPVAEPVVSMLGFGINSPSAQTACILLAGLAGCPVAQGHREPRLPAGLMGRAEAEGPSA